MKRALRTATFNLTQSLIVRWLLNAIGTFNVFNQHAFKAAFGNELDGPGGQELLRQQMVKGLLAIVQR